MIFVDTNVVSELTKVRPNERVIDWLHARRRETLLSSLVIAELAIGIRTTPGPDKRSLLKRMLGRIIEQHEGRVVPFDLPAALRWGEMGGRMIVSGGRSGLVDSMLAAQALIIGAPIATRNVNDFSDTGVVVINPWE